LAHVPQLVEISRDQPASLDPDLARVVTAWVTLPKPIRAAVLALVAAAGKGDGA
jgi:hypothetical protein